MDNCAKECQRWTVSWHWPGGWHSVLRAVIPLMLFLLSMEWVCWHCAGVPPYWYSHALVGTHTACVTPPLSFSVYLPLTFILLCLLLYLCTFLCYLRLDIISWYTHFECLQQWYIICILYRPTKFLLKLFYCRMILFNLTKPILTQVTQTFYNLRYPHVGLAKFTHNDAVLILPRQYRPS